MMKKLFTTSNWKAEINPDFIHFNDVTNFSPERNIEVMYWEIRKYFFEELWLIDEDDVEDEMQIFNSSYWLLKTKFQYIERNIWWRYIDHQIRVTYKLLKESKNPSFRKVFMSLDHDTLEDTNITCDALQQILANDEIPFWVLLISKEPFKNFLKWLRDRLTFRKIDNSWILNSKWLLKDSFLKKLKKHPEKITKEEFSALEDYKKLEIKYKKIRNEIYFSHMKDFDTFYKYALKLAKNHRIRLSKDEMKEICIDAIEVKIFDRIDNLETAEVYKELTEENIKKAKRKIKETKTYFYKISSEIHPDLYDRLKYEVEKLENFIIESEKAEVKSKVWDTLKIY